MSLSCHKAAQKAINYLLNSEITFLISFRYYINKHLNHKLIIDKRTLSPRVIVKLIISPQGDVSDIKVLRSIDPILDKEAIRVCRSLPKFVPGRKNGTSDFLPYITTVTFKPDFE